MSANSVLPPFDGMRRACSSEYIAGTGLNELSECQSRLPMPNNRRRSSRANTCWCLSRLDTSANVVGRRYSSGARRLVPIACSSSPRLSLNASCSSSSRCWSWKTSTAYSSIAAWTAAACSGDSALRRSSPSTSAAKHGPIWRVVKLAIATSPLSIEPGIHETAAHTVAVVAAKALHVRGVHDVPRPHRQIHVIRLVGEIALDVEDDLATPRRIQLATLRAQHAVELGIVDAAAIARRAAEERLVEDLVDLGGAGAERAHGHLVVLAEERHRRVLHVVLGLELGFDADAREVVDRQLEVAAPRRGEARPVGERHTQPPAEARFGQKLVGLSRIVTVEILTSRRLQRGRIDLPLRHHARDRPRVETAFAIVQRLA